MSVWIRISIVLVVALISIIVTILVIKKRTVKKINYMLDAFEDGETNFKFREKDSLNRALNRLRRIFEKQKIINEQESWTQLTRVLTHEIMNTLSPVVSLTDSLSKNKKFHDDETLKESFEIIADSSHHLIEFVNTYRQITGIARPVRQRMDLVKTIKKTIKLNEQILSEKKVNVSMEFPEDEIRINADEIQVTQVIQNLIKNAWQAESRNIEFRLRNLSDSTIIVWVKNDGTPIPIEAQEQIFIPFYTTKEDGTGIGLSVCRQIMRYHKGSITLVRSNRSETIFELIFI